MAGEHQEEPQALAALEIEQLLRLFIGILAAKAWQHMGYRLPPGKDEVERDLARAAAAIDCVAFLVERLSPYVDDGESRRLRAMVTDLQINYAKAT